MIICEIPNQSITSQDQLVDLAFKQLHMLTKDKKNLDELAREAFNNLLPTNDPSTNEYLKVKLIQCSEHIQQRLNEWAKFVTQIEFFLNHSTNKILTVILELFKINRAQSKQQEAFSDIYQVETLLFKECKDNLKSYLHVLQHKIPDIFRDSEREKKLEIFQIITKFNKKMKIANDKITDSKVLDRSIYMLISSETYRPANLLKELTNVLPQLPPQTRQALLPMVIYLQKEQRIADKIKDFLESLADALLPTKKYSDAIEILKLINNQIFDGQILFYLPSQLQIFLYVYGDLNFYAQFSDVVEKFRYLAIGLVGLETENISFDQEMKLLKNLYMKNTNYRNVDQQITQLSVEMQYKLAQSIVNYVVDQFSNDKKFIKWEDPFPTVSVADSNLDLYQCNNPKFNSSCFLSNIVLGLYDAITKKVLIKTEQILVKEMPTLQTLLQNRRQFEEPNRQNPILQNYHEFCDYKRQVEKEFQNLPQYRLQIFCKYIKFFLQFNQNQKRKILQVFKQKEFNG